MVTGSWPRRPHADRLLDYLIGLGVVSAARAPGASRAGGGVARAVPGVPGKPARATAGEVGRHAAVAGLFVGSAVPAGGTGWAGVTAGDVTRFLVRECGGRSGASGCKLVSELRSFLRFAQLDGCTAVPLSQALPPVATWSAGSLPHPGTLQEAVPVTRYRYRGSKIPSSWVLNHA